MRIPQYALGRLNTGGRFYWWMIPGVLERTDYWEFQGIRPWWFGEPCYLASPPRLCLPHRAPCCSVDVGPPESDVLVPYVFSKISKRLRGSYASTLLYLGCLWCTSGAFFKSVHQNRGENSTQHFKKYKDRLNYTMLTWGLTTTLKIWPHGLHPHCPSSLSESA